MQWLGIELDETLNAKMISGQEGLISKASSRVKIMVIPTNEELLIARDTVRTV
jgi:acetate kinase